MLRSLALAALAVVGSFPAHALQGSWFSVSSAPDPAADFDDLQLAIDSVPDGSTLLLGPGAFEPTGDFFAIDGKGLRIVGSTNVSAPTSAPLWVSNLDPGQEVVLRGLGRVGSSEDSGFTVVGAEDCLGALTIEDCRLDGVLHDLNGSTTSPPNEYGVLATDVAALNLIRCRLQGGRNSWGNAGAGLGVSGSTQAVAYDCEFFGVCGTLLLFGGDCAQCKGGVVASDGGKAWIIDGRAVGDTCLPKFDPFGTGSASSALTVFPGGSVVVRGATLEPGSVGGAPVPDVTVWPTGTFTELDPGVLRGVSGCALVDAGSATQLELFGAAQDLVWLGFSGAATWLPLTDLDSVLNVAAPFEFLGPYVLGPAGDLVLGVQAPALPMGSAALFHLQSLHVPLDPGAGPLLTLGASTVVVVRG